MWRALRYAYELRQPPHRRFSPSVRVSLSILSFPPLSLTISIPPPPPPPSRIPLYPRQATPHPFYPLRVSLLAMYLSFLLFLSFLPCLILSFVFSFYLFLTLSLPRLRSEMSRWMRTERGGVWYNLLHVVNAKGKNCKSESDFLWRVVYCWVR